MSLGERFRAAREQRGLTLSDVAEHVRIRSVYLAAIEEENWKAIGAPVYIRGFLRTYARFLGLDPEEAVSQFNALAGTAAAPAAGPAHPSKYEARQQGGSLAPLIWVAGIIALALVGFVIYLAVTPPRGSGQVAATSGGPTAPSLTNGSATAMPMSPRPSGPASASASPSPAPLPQTRTLAIHLTAPSWLRVTVDGNVSIEGTFPAGTTKSFHGKTALVRVGNAGGVEITVDGKTVGKLGGAGDVAEKNFTL
ncbi:MAG TPA: RodZ domain-containing protein [Candidatus Baltobacteraceae bacterium]|nr:RodZ domain-containing protein [Candidatus Baltobacteraceae bacterium]